VTDLLNVNGRLSEFVIELVVVRDGDLVDVRVSVLDTVMGSVVVVVWEELSDDEMVVLVVTEVLGDGPLSDRESV
jgi:hypothetical protein